MKKVIIRTLIVIGIIIALILLDTAQAVIFNNDPIIGVTRVSDKYWKTKTGLFVTTKTYCNYYKEVWYNWHAHLMNRPVKGCEGGDVDEAILHNIIKLTELMGDSLTLDDYQDNDNYEVLHSFVASPKAIEEMYKDGKFTDKEAYVAALIIEDITKCDVASEFKTKWDSAEEFFELWDKSECKTKKKLYKALEIYE